MEKRELSFTNTQVAFKTKTDKQLKKAYWLFRFVSYSWLIQFGKHFLAFALKIRLPVLGIVKATVFEHFCGGETIADCKKVITELGKNNIATILDYSVEGKEKEEEFDENTNKIIASIIRGDVHSRIPFCVFKMTGIARLGLLEDLNLKKKLTEDEKAEYKRVYDRVYAICERAKEADVGVLIDAEESWIQDPVDALVNEMMNLFNKEKAIVYNTIQLYRWDRYEFLCNMLEDAQRNDYFIGVKLVRGAYMEKERLRAKRVGYRSPIQDDKQASDKDFDLSSKFCIENINRISVCCATHNEESNLYMVKLMEEHKLARDDSRVYFAQLYGMSDHISFNLAAAGYNVAKYVPYGPVREVVPYLIRRAEENTSVAGQTGRELGLITQELERRRQ
jgi:proline dehydrogenase